MEVCPRCLGRRHVVFVVISSGQIRQSSMGWQLLDLVFLSIECEGDCVFRMIAKSKSMWNRQCEINYLWR